MSISLEELLKKDNPSTTTTITGTPVIKQDVFQYIDNYLTKIVRIMELGSNIIQNAQKLKGIVTTNPNAPSPTASAIDDMIKNKANIPKLEVKTDDKK